MEKTIAGFEHYTITEDGLIHAKERVILRTDGHTYTQRRQVMKPILNKRYGRYMVGLLTGVGREKKTIWVHRLVALTFIPNPNGYKEVNHINGVKTDNRVVNLEWCDRTHNMRHAFKMGLFPDRSGENHSNYKGGISKREGYDRVWRRAKSRCLDWKSLTEQQREELFNLKLRV